MLTAKDTKDLSQIYHSTFLRIDFIHFLLMVSSKTQALACLCQRVCKVWNSPQSSLELQANLYKTALTSHIPPWTPACLLSAHITARLNFGYLKLWILWLCTAQDVSLVSFTWSSACSQSPMHSLPPFISSEEKGTLKILLCPGVKDQLCVRTQWLPQSPVSTCIGSRRSIWQHFFCPNVQAPCRGGTRRFSSNLMASSISCEGTANPLIGVLQRPLLFKRAAYCHHIAAHTFGYLTTK